MSALPIGWRESITEFDMQAMVLQQNRGWGALASPLIADEFSAVLQPVSPLGSVTTVRRLHPIGLASAWVPVAQRETAIEEGAATGHHFRARALVEPGGRFAPSVSAIASVP